MKEEKNAFSGIKGYKIIFPIIIGLGVVVLMFWNELYPKPKFRGTTDKSAIEISKGDSIVIAGGSLSYSTDSILYTNVDSLLSYAGVGSLIRCDGDSAFTVLQVVNGGLLCCALEDVSITAKKKISIDGVEKMHVPTVMDAMRSVKITWRFWVFIFLALIFMLGRDAGYIWRIRTLSDKGLSWLQSLRVIILWEFTSAITPSAIGGTSVAILYVTKEGINVGKSSAIVMATSVLDELYFVVMFPILLLLIPDGRLFTVGSSVATGLMVVTLTGYFMKLAWVLVLSYGLFINPKGLRWLIIKVFSLPILRRWKEAAIKAGDEVVVSAKELKYKPIKFWLKSILATFISWTSRYWVVNALFMAFFAVQDHFLIFARQLVMWIMMLVSPTPGGSGFAEFVFKEFLGEFIPVAGLTVVIALLWRLITYYLYLFVGVLVVPGWINNKFGKSRKKKHVEVVTPAS